MGLFKSDELKKAEGELYSMANAVIFNDDGVHDEQIEHHSRIVSELFTRLRDSGRSGEVNKAVKSARSYAHGAIKDRATYRNYVAHVEQLAKA